MLLLSSCGHSLEQYTDTETAFYPVEPKIYVLFDKERWGYYKVAHFTGSYEIAHAMHGPQYNTLIKSGYHLFDGQGYNGYDFEHTFESLDDAIDHAQNSGNVYFFRLGKRYQYHDGHLYRTSPFRKLKKD